MKSQVKTALMNEIVNVLKICWCSTPSNKLLCSTSNGCIAISTYAMTPSLDKKGIGDASAEPFFLLAVMLPLVTSHRSRGTQCRSSYLAIESSAVISEVCDRAPNGGRYSGLCGRSGSGPNGGLDPISLVGGFEGGLGLNGDAGGYPYCGAF